MATESADESELAVTLPPPLEEWLDERADALDVDREEVLAQLVSAYRAAADLDDDDVSRISDADELDDRIVEEIESRIEAPESIEGLDELERRIDTLESELEENVESIRNRLLQVRNAVKERAPKDHSHEEMRRLSDHVDGLAADLDDVATDVAETTEAVDEIDERLSDVESKLNRLARVVVTLRKQSDSKRAERREQLDHIRRQANQHGLDEATCSACGEPVRIGLLTEPACPHCGTEVRDVEPPSSMLGRAFASAKLTGLEAPALEGDDE